MLSKKVCLLECRKSHHCFGWAIAIVSQKLPVINIETIAIPGLLAYLTTKPYLSIRQFPMLNTLNKISSKSTHVCVLGTGISQLTSEDVLVISNI